MNLATFITSNMDTILREWESFARTLLPSAATMDALALRDHAKQILEEVARDIVEPQTAREQRSKSKGAGEQAEVGSQTAAAIHGGLRHNSGFDLRQLFAEFRALRASVLRLWVEQVGGTNGDALYEMTRFNEAIDQALAESVGRYSDDVFKSRDTFIAILGHDLRSPLQAVTASAGALSDPTTSVAVRDEALTRVRNAALSMTQMIRDLLEYTRSQLGKAIPIRPAPANVEAILRSALDEVQAGYPQHSFRFETGGDLAAEVDAPRLQQAVTNLLSNAVRHGRAGAPVKLVAREDGESLAIEVSNDGPPIAEATLQAIFDPMRPYQRVPGKPGSASLGLGLFIAREIATGHGGTINAASTDRGTLFTIRIPRGKVRVAQAAETAQTALSS